MKESIFRVAPHFPNSKQLCQLWKTNNTAQTKYVNNSFTLFILSYERPLDDRIQIFRNMPFLHKILIVKNSNFSALNETLDVPVEVVQAPTNSLNNKFIPYNEIETDAVLVLDDDFNYLTHEIILATYFIWRDHPYSTVGLIERSHEQSKGIYKYVTDPEYQRKYSIILAGAMFIHKNYFTSYTNDMTAEVRRLVDTNMNCEDIAMSFLVAFVSRRPPWLVAHSNFDSRAFGSADSTALSARPDHYKVRDKCIADFLNVSNFIILNCLMQKLFS